MRAPIGMATAFVALLSLMGCSSKPDIKSVPPCPRISILGDAAKMTRFRPGTGRDITDVQYQAEIASYSGSCTYDMDERQMTVTLQVGIDATRGPAASGRETELSYFVAMPVFYPKPEAKQVMPVKISFPSDTSRVRFVDDEVTISFPMRDFKQLKSYEIFLGLQLDQDQLDYNREMRARR